MKRNDWGLEIIYASGGFIVTNNDGEKYPIRADDNDEKKSAEELLWYILDFFNINSSRHDRDCIRVIREAGEKYLLKDNEEFCVQTYYSVSDKKLLKREIKNAKDKEEES